MRRNKMRCAQPADRAYPRLRYRTLFPCFLGCKQDVQAPAVQKPTDDEFFSVGCLILSKCLRDVS